MINLCKSFEYIDLIYLSEKSKKLEKSDIIVVKVKKGTTKKNIKKSIFDIFKIKVKKVNTLIKKRKTKKFKNKIGYSKSWKKAYIFLEKGKYDQYISKLEK